MATVSSRISVPVRAPIALLALANLSLPVGVWIAWIIGQPRFFGLALYIVGGVLLTDVLVFIGRPTLADPEATLKRTLDIRVAVLLGLGSVVALAIGGPGVPFFVGVTLALTVVCLRAFALDDEARSGRSDLAVVLGVAVLVIASQVFTVGYYLNVADTVNHTTAAMVLRDTGFLQAISESRYYRFSTFHVFSAVGMNLSGLRPRTLTAVVILFVFQVALLATYLLFRTLSGSRPLALIGTVLTSVNIAYLHFGTVAHYQSLSFVVFCVFLWLLFRQSWAFRDLGVLVLISLFWIATHHVSVLMAVALTAVPIGYLVVRAWRSGFDRDRFFLTSAFFLFGVMFVGYWVIVTQKFTEVVGWILFSSPAAGGLQSGRYVIRQYGSIEQLAIESLPFFVDSLHYTFLLAITATGVLVLWRSGRLSDQRWQLVLMGFLPAAALYFPSPLWIPLEGVAELSRWRLMVLPFLLLVPAVGLRYGMRSDRSVSAPQKVAIGLLVSVLLFTTVTSGVSNGSITDIANLQKEPREHLTNEELAATEFVYDRLDNDDVVYSRSDLAAYQEEYAWATNQPHAQERFVRLTASDRTGRILVEPGLTVMSVEAFEQEGIRVELVELDPERYPEGATVTSPIFTDSYTWVRTDGNVVYTSGEVVVQQQFEPRANGTDTEG